MHRMPAFMAGRFCYAQGRSCERQASLAQSCNATAANLFAPGYNVTHALREYEAADAAARGVVPHPGTGFTFFLPADAAYGNDSVALSGGASTPSVPGVRE